MRNYARANRKMRKHWCKLREEMGLKNKQQQKKIGYVQWKSRSLKELEEGKE